MNNMTITTPIPMRRAELVPDRGPTDEQMAVMRYYNSLPYPVADISDGMEKAVKELCDMGFMGIHPLSADGKCAELKLKGMAFLSYAENLSKEDADRKFMTM